MVGFHPARSLLISLNICFILFSIIFLAEFRAFNQGPPNHFWSYPDLVGLLKIFNRRKIQKEKTIIVRIKYLSKADVLTSNTNKEFFFNKSDFHNPRCPFSRDIYDHFWLWFKDHECIWPLRQSIVTSSDLGWPEIMTHLKHPSK